MENYRIDGFFFLEKSVYSLRVFRKQTIFVIIHLCSFLVWQKRTIKINKLDLAAGGPICNLWQTYSRTHMHAHIRGRTKTRAWTRIIHCTRQEEFRK